MKNFIFVVIFFLVGCSGGVAYLDQQDSKKLTSAGLDFHDIEYAANNSIKSLLRSGYVEGIVNPKVVAISDITNDTMQNFDTQGLTLKITRVMRNHGKFIVTAAISGNAGPKDNMLNKAREKRNDDEFNQYTTAEKGSLIAPELSLSGKIVQRNVRVQGKQRIDYSFILILSNIKTGLVVWDDETNITKVLTGNAVSW